MEFFGYVVCHTVFHPIASVKSPTTILFFTAFIFDNEAVDFTVEVSTEDFNLCPHTVFNLLTEFGTDTFHPKFFANGFFVFVDIPLSLEIQQVIRIKIWAYSNVIEAANNMLLRIVAHGAASSELWSGNAIDVANHPSEETGGIVQYDVIHWIIDAGDDAQVGTLLGGDLMELMAIGETALAPDIATDALFGGYEIEYV